MSILNKLDGIQKGWKRHSTSAVFLALTGAFATKGIDLSLYVESAEAVYAWMSTGYAGIMIGLKLIADRRAA